jgi:16S rRNA (guanine527-N7)-methyltransferase
MNLTAITGEKDVAELHFLDCAAVLNAADFSKKRVIDVGTGAGFPGMVLKYSARIWSLRCWTVWTSV